jgi:hypothetical protein
MITKKFTHKFTFFPNSRLEAQSEIEVYVSIGINGDTLTTETDERQYLQNKLLN